MKRRDFAKALVFPIAAMVLAGTGSRARARPAAAAPAPMPPACRQPG